MTEQENKDIESRTVITGVAIGKKGSGNRFQEYASHN